jgi:hypothetical protein
MPTQSFAGTIPRDQIPEQPKPARWERRAYRHNAIFVSDELAHVSKLDRNQRAKLLFLAEQFERAEKAPGRRNGRLGFAGLAVLRALLLRFHNRSSGLCCPSYTALAAYTGLCRQAVADALARLEHAGIVRIVRRIARERITRLSPYTGEPETIVTTLQQSNLYSFGLPQPGRLALPAPNPRPFPSRRQGYLNLVYSADRNPTQSKVRKGLSGEEAGDWRARARAVFQIWGVAQSRGLG